jgi:hypothetical protein
MLREKLGLKEICGMSELLTRVQPYINNEEKLIADKVEKGKPSNKNWDKKGHDNDSKEKIWEFYLLMVCYDNK